MNTTVPNAKNWPDDRRGKLLAAKRSGLRAIDKGTSYDIPGKLRRLTHEIENGKHGDVRGIVLGLLCEKDGKLKMNDIFCGKASMAELHLLAAYLEKETGLA